MAEWPSYLFYDIDVQDERADPSPAPAAAGAQEGATCKLQRSNLFEGFATGTIGA